MRTIFIDLHKFAERYRKQGVLGGREGIEAEPVFEAGNKHGKAERSPSPIPGARDRPATAPAPCLARAPPGPSPPLWLILLTCSTWLIVLTCSTLAVPHYIGTTLRIKLITQSPVLNANGLSCTQDFAAARSVKHDASALGPDGQLPILVLAGGPKIFPSPTVTLSVETARPRILGKAFQLGRDQLIVFFNPRALRRRHTRIPAPRGPTRTSTESCQCSFANTPET